MVRVLALLVVLFIGSSASASQLKTFAINEVVYVKGVNAQEAVWNARHGNVVIRGDITDPAIKFIIERNFTYEEVTINNLKEV